MYPKLSPLAPAHLQAPDRRGGVPRFVSRQPTTSCRFCAASIISRLSLSHSSCLDGVCCMQVFRVSCSGRRFRVGTPPPCLWLTQRTVLERSPTTSPIPNRMSKPPPYQSWTCAVPLLDTAMPPSLPGSSFVGTLATVCTTTVAAGQRWASEGSADQPKGEAIRMTATGTLLTLRFPIWVSPTTIPTVPQVRCSLGPSHPADISVLHPLEDTISTQSYGNSDVFQNFQNVLSDMGTSSQSTIWQKQLSDGASMTPRRFSRHHAQPTRLRGLDETDDCEWDHLQAPSIDLSRMSHLTLWPTTSPRPIHL